MKDQYHAVSHIRAKAVRILSPKERLRLRAMSFNNLTKSKEQFDFDDSWSEEDLQHLTTFALSHCENPHESKKKESS